MAARNQPERNQTKDLKCATHLLSDKFRNMSEEKKTIVRDLGFGGLMHIPPLRVHHQVLRELANNFKLGENRLEIGYGSFKITPRKIGHALGYDCAIYVMKWLELIEPENIKKGNDEWDNWKQDEVDHYRVEYALRILFSEMNKERDQAIRASNAIRLSKPSSVLLSPFCQINSTDIETE
ncbi:uncharacterized protein DS421_6g175180 [Arachis hypogaea]|nr:uncharacterized protein DS421_6g175180 [Arachis hypogaea]